MLELRTILPSDYTAWTEMVKDYNAEITEQDIDNTWEQFGKHPTLDCMIAKWNGERVGFMCYLEHEFALHSPRCYLSDLYVKPEYRRLGIARSMLEFLLKKYKKRKMTVYWVTENTNMAARTLYDQYAVQEFIRYDVDS